MLRKKYATKFLKNRVCFSYFESRTGIILKLFLVRNRVRLLGSQRRTLTLKFRGYPRVCWMSFKKKTEERRKIGEDNNNGNFVFVSIGFNTSANKGRCYFKLVQHGARNRIHCLHHQKSNFLPTHKTASSANYGRISLIV